MDEIDAFKGSPETEEGRTDHTERFARLEIAHVFCRHNAMALSQLLTRNQLKLPQNIQ